MDEEREGGYSGPEPKMRAQGSDTGTSLSHLFAPPLTLPSLLLGRRYGSLSQGGDWKSKTNVSWKNGEDENV